MLLCQTENMGLTINYTDNSEKFLDALPARVREGLEEIGKRAERYAKDTVPVDTGELQRSIGYDVTGDTLTLGAGTDHAAPVELGTRRMSARPYLRPAMENHGEEYREIMEAALKG